MLWLLNLTDLFYLKSIKPQKTYILLVQVCSARGWKELKVSYGRSFVTSASPLPPQNKKNKTHTAPSNTTPVHTPISQHGKWFHDIWWLWEISWSQSSSHRISTHFTNTHWILIILHFCGEFQLWWCFIHMFWEGVLLRAKPQPWNPSGNLNQVPSIQAMVAWETERQPAWNTAL